MDNVLAQHEARQAARPIYEYDLPPELAALGDAYVKKSIGVVKLEASEELAAIDLAGNSSGRIGYFMARASLVEVDGQPLDRGNGQHETVFDRTDPAIRTLIIRALTDVGGLTEEQTAVFLKSRRVKVR